MNYLIDTDIVSYFLRGVPRIVDSLASIPIADWAISAISAYELQRGAMLQPQNAALGTRIQEFLAATQVLEVGPAQTMAAAQISAQLQTAGNSLAHLDALIAGHALSLGATLVTNNSKHFARVAGLKIESW